MEVECGSESFIVAGTPGTPCQRELGKVGLQRSGKRDRQFITLAFTEEWMSSEAWTHEGNREPAGSVG